ncbi:hypothetical protein [Streptomyces sp. NPDC056387]|uniref:hypothetical protein n=1 Tax=Streptomyces sp. NPDC056387 TaxID=3345803 RepID=UPI0035E367F0
MSSPVQFTDEQRDQLLRAAAGVTTAMQAYITAMLPAVQAAAAQFRQLYAALQTAGLLDEHGQPVHIGQGENAEDYPACRGTNPPYPFLCPGQPEPGPSGADPEPDGILHAQRRHPDWEYATTEGPRKQWDDIDVPPRGEDGEPDPTWERNLDAGHPGEGWERFDYTEESYWRRPKRPGTPPAERPTRPIHADGTPYRYAEIVAEGWSSCDGCHRWSRTWTPKHPHVCPNEPKAATS